MTLTQPKLSTPAGIPLSFQILDVPILEGDVQLVRPKVLYQYADPGLETLSPLQKQVLRAGPQNVDRLQHYLVRLRGALG